MCIHFFISPTLDNCFFRDPIASQSIPINYLSSTPSSHRKIQSYITTNGDATDRTGHGTHIIGTIVGEVETRYYL